MAAFVIVSYTADLRMSSANAGFVEHPEEQPAFASSALCFTDLSESEPICQCFRRSLRPNPEKPTVNHPREAQDPIPNRYLLETSGETSRLTAKNQRNHEAATKGLVAVMTMVI